MEADEVSAQRRCPLWHVQSINIEFSSSFNFDEGGGLALFLRIPVLAVTVNQRLISCGWRLHFC